MQFNWESIGIKIRVEKNGIYIFDPYRKKYILATPEEEVRQYTLFRLTTQLNYPANSIAVERQIQYGSRVKRFDILVYADGKPFLLIECKAPHIELSDKTFAQAGEYNHVLKVPFIAITNGRQLICAAFDNVEKTHHFLPDFPAYNRVSN
ncbi:MAG: restriction endonuclease subunit R [Bacteroidetes bacterium]|nr:restriction endonuclease subunit R [Bacteroidota bacterium]